MPIVRVTVGGCELRLDLPFALRITVDEAAVTDTRVERIVATPRGVERHP